MKNVITQLNKAFESRIRLGIMSILMVNDWVDFGELKETLALTDGNLASHIAALEKEQFIAVRKSFIGKKPNTAFQVTQEGREAFKSHLVALEELVKGMK
ncbi:transcriptional regulator [Flectobacillus sp. DC10W]|jgi:DNA-binding MarR family transcriptional regulator|uniref:Transcriptional regulator n=1 Tax=Flectobacillus longus TaxID=2984207 RepID=A0ABT6YKW3_9BACT|nr:transcriptional regulator [Flectobacillus longus]MDI9864190.1 transcriptional regulator [Flectobacillus longus]